MSDRTTRTPSNILYLLGVLLGLALAVLAIWAAFEGQSYFFTGATHEPFYGLHCPIFMTRPETGTITATFDNPSDQEMQPYYEVEISGPLARKFENQLSVPTYQSKTVEWTVDANDIDLGSFIFVQMQILPDGTHRTRQAVCGIFVLNVPGATGDTIFTLALILSLAGIVVGFTIQDNLPNKDMNVSRSMRALGIAVLLAMLAAFMSWWLAGIVFCAIVILLLFILLRFAAI